MAPGVAFDDDADTVVHAEYAQVDVAIAFNAQAGDAHDHVRVAGYAVRNTRLPLSSLNGVSLPRGAPLKVLRLSTEMPLHSCCSRLALSTRRH